MWAYHQLTAYQFDETRFENYKCAIGIRYNNKLLNISYKKKSKLGFPMILHRNLVFSP